jgi:hypothetical protein
MIALSNTKRLNAREASKLIHGTDQPSKGQVRWVEHQFELGAIEGSCPRKAKAQWTTTTGAIALYMAEVSLPRVAAPGTATATATPRGRAELGDVYRDVLKDYFLAMIFRRGQRANSTRFRRAVVVGQVVALLVIVWATVLSVSPLLAGSPAEQTVVENWIGENAEQFNVVRWHSSEPLANGRGLRVRVEYRYASPGGKLVTTERVFTVEGGRVVSVDSF